MVERKMCYLKKIDIEKNSYTLYACIKKLKDNEKLKKMPRVSFHM